MDSTFDRPGIRACGLPAAIPRENAGRASSLGPVRDSPITHHGLEIGEEIRGYRGTETSQIILTVDAEMA